MIKSKSRNFFRSSENKIGLRRQRDMSATPWGERLKVDAETL